MTTDQNAVPKTCYVPLLTTLEAGIVKFGEDGYYKTDWGNVAQTQTELDEFIKFKNKKLGVTPAQAEAMQICSMFGCWQNFENIVGHYQAKKETENE